MGDRDVIVIWVPVCPASAVGYGADMEIMGRFRNRSGSGRRADDGHFVLIETDEHEQIVLSGSSDDEMQAKLEDFLTWAS